MLHRAFGAAVASLLLLGCAPELIVRHLDPGVPRADIWVNGEKVSSVDYGESASIALQKGPYRVKASRSGEATNGWLEGGGEWNVVVLGDVVLSLMPTPKPGREPADEQGAATP